MPKYETVLPVSPEDAVVHLRSAVTTLVSVEQARSDAIAAVREAVMAARVMKVPWDAIGKELGVSRQAVSERFGGDVRMQLVTAWHSVELLLAKIALARGYQGQPKELLEQLSREGAISADVCTDALRLYRARSEAVHGVNSQITAEDADRLTDVAIPLNGILWLLQHGDTIR
jgi:hypothetical protein